ncbi:MAG: DeoR/GlpR family DNA-binding transcription regulator [Bauldia sp.]|nr:DeoR/GlpR family DNA-binding transcription regulator [Bauldia sp.]
MTPRERQALIVEQVRQSERVFVDDLAESLGASRETIRRDLTALANRGVVKKFHGGATMPHPDAEGPFQARMALNASAKQRIAAAAAKLFKPGDALFVDTGSTTLYFAEALAEVGGITVITNSSAIARQLGLNGSEDRVFLLGGEFQADNQETVGTLTLQQIKSFRPNYAVITIGALHAEAGIMDYDFDEAQVALAMIEQAARLIVLVDASKFDQLALIGICGLDEIDVLVCDAAPGGALAEALARADVEIVLA